MAKAAEAAAKQQAELRNRTKDNSIHQTKEDNDGWKTGDRKRSEPKTQKKVDNRCFRCKGKHKPTDCKFSNTVCSYCKKTGHIQKACFSKKKAQEKQHKSHHMDNSEASSEDDSLYDIHQVHSVIKDASPSFTMGLTVHGKHIPFEVDSGSAYTIISEETFRQTWSRSRPKLYEKDVHLRTWSGEGLPLAGTCDVRVRWKTKDYLLPLLVVKGRGCNLLGRNWFKPLRIELNGIYSVEPQDQLESILQKHSAVFSDTISGRTGAPVDLELKDDARPQFQKARPVPFALRPAVEKELEKWERQGIVTPIQHSDWATPVVIVRKKDGSIRMCGDYRSTVNLMTKKTAYPLPTASEVLANLQGGKLFSTLDLAQAYQQLQVTPETAHILTLNTVKGLYAVKRLPFGVAAAPAIFQRFMETVLAGIEGTSVYLDDVIVSGSTKDEHYNRLELVLSRLEQANLRLRKDKCRFAVPEVCYLGHRIDAQGIHTTEEKVKALMEAPEPRNKAELQSFLGLLAFYDKFLPDRATIAKDLYDLLGKERLWTWQKQHSDAYTQLKQLVNKRTVLAHYDKDKPLLLSCDASPYGLGAVLAQPDCTGQEAPITFASRTLGDAERNYSQLDREGLAVVFAITKFHSYIAGRHVKIITDHKPLLGIFGNQKPVPQVLSPRMIRWCIKLSAYDYELVYRKGSQHQNADCMSRLPLQAKTDEPHLPGDVLMLEALQTPPFTIEELSELTAKDEVLAAVHKAVKDGTISKLKGEKCQAYVRRASELGTHNGCLTRGTRVVIPNAARKRALDLVHAGHRGIVARKACARSYLWWPGIDDDIQARVEQCARCQQHRRLPPKTVMKEWTRATQPWDTIHLDFAGPLEGVMLLIVVDSYTKWLEVRIVRRATASAVVEELRGLFATFGIPRKVVSDNGTPFVALDTQDFFRRNGIRSATSAPYHPATNGQAERMVAETKTALMRDQEGTLKFRLARFLFKQHTTVHTTTGCTPAAAMFGRELPSVLTYLKAKKSHEPAKDPKISRVRNLRPGQTVLLRNFLGMPKWITGTLVRKLGERSWVMDTAAGLAR
ncbi:uncharacterized protein K02A2.6-like [Ornithodoros turicata]|uniref:uncharacterized protein K02A2.6-like n=1 Tax=Ornithodoros turicata TaxID=34597 RepID=UPI0031399C03